MPIHRMHRKSLYSFILIAGTMAFCSQALATEVPLQLRDFLGHTVWLAEDIAIDEAGRLRTELFHNKPAQLEEVARRNSVLQSERKNELRAGEYSKREDDPLAGCSLFTGVGAHASPPATSATALIDGAHTIFSGTVIDAKQGFWGGEPGTLLLLNGEYLKGPPHPNTLIFYPLARINVREGLICNRPLVDFIAPRSGDRMIIFSMVEPMLLEYRRFAALPLHVHVGLVHKSQSGSAFLPSPFSLEGLVEFDQAEERVMNALGVKRR